MKGPAMRFTLVMMALALIAPVRAGAQGGAAVCGWGGTAQNRTGVFTVEPGLKNIPSLTSLHLMATGALSGNDPRCVGITMTIEGIVDPGSGCVGIIHHSGTVSFTDSDGNAVDRGITHYEGTGPAYGRELFYGPDGELKATADPFARSSDQIPFTESCNSEEGLTQGTFAAATGLVFVDGLPAAPIMACSWGGTPLAPTGRAAISAPGVKNDPSTAPISFTATGGLEGPGCSGSMTFVGTFLPGATCKYFFAEGDVYGVQSVSHFEELGSLWTPRGLLYDDGGNIVGTYDAQVVTGVDLADAEAACDSSQGFHGGFGFSGVVPAEFHG